MSIRLGAPDENHLVLKPIRRSHPEATGFFDGNWLKVEVTARGGAFHGSFEADLRCDELLAFTDALEALGAAAPAGGEGAPAAAALESMEGWVKVRLTASRRGPMEGTAEVRDDPALGASLRFPLTVEPAALPGLLVGLRDLLRRFPVVGHPDEPGSALLAEGDGGEDGPG